MDPEIVAPVHVVREFDPELARRAERLAVDELGLQYPVGRLVDGVVVGAAHGRQRPLYAEGLEHQVDLGVVELAAAVRVEDLDVRDREGERRERRPDQPGVLCVLVAKLLRWYISFFSVAKNDSATALSWQLPVRLQERRTW